MSQQFQNQILSLELSTALESLIERVKTSLKDSKNVAISAAWGILQLAISDTIQAIENTNPSLKGSNKKEIALNIVSSFYDKVFLVVTIPYLPAFLQPTIQRYTKALLMLLVASSIDSMVEIFRKSGVFVATTVDNNPKVSDK
jgi:hypothetical protein